MADAAQTLSTLKAQERAGTLTATQVNWRNLFDVEARHAEAFADVLAMVDQAWQQMADAHTGAEAIKELVRALDNPVPLKFGDGFAEMQKPFHVTSRGLHISPELVRKIWQDGQREDLPTNRISQQSMAAVLVHEIDHLIYGLGGDTIPCAEAKAIARADAFRAEKGLPLRKTFYQAEGDLAQILKQLSPDMLAQVQTLRQQAGGAVQGDAAAQDGPAHNVNQQVERIAQRMTYMNQGCTPLSQEQMAADARRLTDQAISQALEQPSPQNTPAPHTPARGR